MQQNINFSFLHTKRVEFGANIVSELSEIVNDLQLSRAVVVTDRYIAEKTDLLDRVKKALGRHYVETYTGVEPDSGAPSIDQGALFAKDQKAELLVSLGGGSTIDTAKGMTVVMSLGESILDHEGYHNIERPLVPHIAIPTTAGTGSEMTMVAVIKDPVRGQKTFIGSRYLLPRVALLDPTLVTDLPARLTAATGLDAMSHAVESLYSTLSQPFSDACALEAIRLIAANLPQCLDNPEDLSARGNMLIAANLAGSAFSNAMVSLNHAMAHALGAKYAIHHGTANAMLLAHSMRFFSHSASRPLAQAARTMGISTTRKSEEQAAGLAADWMENFVRNVGLNDRLRDFKVTERDLTEIAEMAMMDGAIIHSPKPDIEPEDIIEILKKTW